MEWSMTTSLLFLQDIDLSLKFRMRLNLAWVTKYHTTLNLILVDTTEQKSNIITSLTFVQYLSEHFNARNHGFFTIST